MATAETERLLRDGLAELDLRLEIEQVAKLLQYLDLFDKWNRAYNLSAIRKPQDMVRLHLLDSLTVARYLTGERLIDVGTGGGLPGIPLAIAFPDKQFTLLDSAGKKTRFLFQVKQQLELANVDVENCRVEAHRPDQPYDGVISRAFASLADMTRHCQHLITDGGRYWAMKGVTPDDELQAIAVDYAVEHCHLLKVPGVDAQRCLLVLQPRKSQEAVENSTALTRSSGRTRTADAARYPGINTYL